MSKKFPPLEDRVYTATELRKRSEEYYNSPGWREKVAPIEKAQRELFDTLINKCLELIRRSNE